jgi:eukaryotic-like serine/threonine-protein kinase
MTGRPSSPASPGGGGSAPCVSNDEDCVTPDASETFKAWGKRRRNLGNRQESSDNSWVGVRLAAGTMLAEVRRAGRSRAAIADVSRDCRLVLKGRHLPWPLGRSYPSEIPRLAVCSSFPMPSLSSRPIRLDLPGVSLTFGSDTSDHAAVTSRGARLGRKLRGFRRRILMDGLLEDVWSDRSLSGKYLFERHIATSSMAVVVAAMHLELEERVAIKFLSPDALRSSTAVSRFRSEAKAAAKIKSQHVVRIVDVATTANNIPYIVMEFLDGKDLEQLLAQFPQRRAPIADAVDFILQASEAVCEGHSLGIVHRDLKPANLFCVDRGDGYPLIKVLDFGISKFTNPFGELEHTDRYEILGSPRYMSPEQIEAASNVNHKTDVWSLGVILYEALSGKPPFDDERLLNLWRKIKEDDPEPISQLRTDCPPALWEVITKCLQKDPDERFGDLGQLAQALTPFAPERSRPCIGRILWLTEATRTSTIKASLFNGSYDRVMTNPTQRRRRWMIAGGIASTIGLGIGLLGMRAHHARPLARVSSPVRIPLNLSPGHSASSTGREREPMPSAAPEREPMLPVEVPAALADVAAPSVVGSSVAAAGKSGRRHKPKPPSATGISRTTPTASVSDTAATPPYEAPSPLPSNAIANDNEKTGDWLMPPVTERK